MKEQKVIDRPVMAYKNVFSRNEVKQFSFYEFIKTPEVIFLEFGQDNFKQELDNIRNIADKEERNLAKRNYIPAVDLSQSGILSIDIDGIFNNPDLKSKIISKLQKLNSTLCVMDSVSGNLVAFFQYECKTVQFPYLYYKIYLELTLLLSVNIDFLPEIGRLRYVSIGEIHHFNDNSEILTEALEVDELPYINTSVKKDKARKIIFGSN